MSDSQTQVRIDLTADPSGLSPGVPEAKRQLDDVKGTAEDLGGELQRAAAFGTALGTVIADLASAAVRGFAQYAAATVETADAMGDLSVRTGESMQHLAAYDLMAKQSGTTLNEVVLGMRNFNRYLVEHGEKLRQAGIDTRDSSAAFRQFMDLIAGIQDPALRTALAVEVLGRSGDNLLPMLAGGSAAFDTAAEKSAGYAAQLERLAPQADAFNDNMAEIKMHMLGLGMAVAEGVVPVLRGLMEHLSSTSGNTKDLSSVTDVARNVLAALIITGASGVYAFERLGQAIGASAAILQAIASAEYGRIPAILREASADADVARNKLDALVSRLAEGGKSWHALADGATAAGGATDEAGKKIVKNTEKIAAAKKEVDELAKVLNKINTKDNGLDASYWKDLETLHKALESGRLTLGQYMEAVTKLSAQQKAHKDVVKEEEAAAKAYQKAVDEATAAREKDREALEKELKNLEEELRLYGLTEAQIKAKAVAELEEAIARARANGALEAGIADLEKELALRRQIASAAGEKERLDQEVGFWKSVTEAGHRAWTDITNNGKNMWERLKETGKSIFFEWLWSAAAKPLIFNLIASVSGMGVAQQVLGATSGTSASGIGGGFGLGDMASLYASGGGLANWAGQGLISISNATGWQGIGDYGADLISGSSAIPLGGIISAYSQGGIGGFMTGVGTTALAGGISGMMAGTGFLSGATGALGAMGPIGWAALAAAAILGGMQDRGGPKTEGGWTYGIDENGNAVDMGTGWLYSDGRKDNKGYSGNAAMADSLANLAPNIQTLLTSLGGSGAGMNYSLQFNTDPQGDAPDMVASSIRDKDGNILYEHANNNLERGSYQEELAVEAKRLLLGAIQAADVDPIFQRIAASVDLATASLEELDQALLDISNAQAILGYADSDPFADYAEMAEAAGRSTMELLDAQQEKLDELASAYDGSSDSLADLAAATQERYNLELQLAQEIANGLKSTTAMFDDALRQIKLDVLDDPGKYSFYDEEAANYRDLLAGATDPAQIAEYSKGLKENIMAGWNLLSDDQKAAHYEEYKKLLEEARELEKEQYAAAKAEAQAEHQRNADLLEQALNRGATALEQKAKTPQTIDVQVELTVPVGYGYTYEAMVGA